MKKATLTAMLALMFSATASAYEDSPTSKQDKVHKALGWALMGTAATDFLSTHAALRNGAYEANPLPFQQNNTGRAVSKVAFTGLIWWVTDKAYKDGHKKTALWVRVAAVGLWGYATAHNLRQATR